MRFGALGPAPSPRAQLPRFGDGSMIAFPPTVIFGEGRIAVGEGTTIGPLASLSAGMPTQANLRGDPVITIGDRCTLGKGIGIVGHERIEIGDDIWTGHYVYVTDQNHGYEDISTCRSARRCGRTSRCRSATAAGSGHGAVVLPGSRIGRHVVVAAGAVVAGLDVPDFSVRRGRARAGRAQVRPGGGLGHRPPGRVNRSYLFAGRARPAVLGYDFGNRSGGDVVLAVHR